MAKKEKKKTRAMTAITWLLFGALLISWLVPATALALVGASVYQTSFRNYYSSTDGFTYAKKFNSALESTQPYELERVMLEEIRKVNQTRYGWGGPTIWSYQLPTLTPSSLVKNQQALVAYDPEGNLLFENGDYMSFTGFIQRDWSDPENLKFANGQFMYIKFEPEDREAFAELYEYYESSLQWLPFIEALRITGTLEGCRIIPQKIEYLTSGLSINNLNIGNTTNYIYDAQGNNLGNDYYESFRQQDEKGRNAWLSWGEKATTDENLITIYVYDENLPVCMTIYEPTPVTYKGVTYDSLLELLKAQDSLIQREDDTIGYIEKAEIEVNTLTRQLHFVLCHARDKSDYDPETDPYPEPALKVLYAMEGSPLGNILSDLRYIYLISAVVVLLLWLILCRTIRRRLVKHIQIINAGINNDWDPHINGSGEPWREVAQLRERYFDEGDHRRQAHNEITRLNTALQYAKEAEENRRQMTSNIAHELKTPLAIIHSYSEALQENINEEKKEQYLDTILTESERMDAMVLEMLDLSRLEAGKIKLQRDEFSLSTLTKEVFDTFAPMAEAKGLQVTMLAEGDCPVVADEARIGQVIRNYASNAVRYTPEGGTILVRVRPGILGTVLTVENSGCHFTQEELTKVWESFYRSDKSRDRKGTGLGLAIVKNIVALHGGKCGARNTQNGVEFSLILK